MTNDKLISLMMRVCVELSEAAHKRDLVGADLSIERTIAKAHKVMSECERRRLGLMCAELNRHVQGKADRSEGGEYG